jgi:hypothetical protein
MTRLLEIVAEVGGLITSAGRRDNAAGGDKELCSCPPFVSQLMRKVQALLPPQYATSEGSKAHPRPSAFQGMGDLRGANACLAAEIAAEGLRGPS